MLADRIPEPELMDVPEEAAAYAAADFSAVNQAFVDRLVELLGPPDVPRALPRALDLGTGPADIPLRVIRLRPNLRITAVDGSAAMLRLARSAIERAGAGAAERIQLVRADAKSLPFPAGSFDVIFSNSLLHHVADPAAMWSEIRRLIRPAGLIFLRDLARPATTADAAAIVEQYAGNESPMLREEFYRSLLAAYRVEEVRGQVELAALQQMNVAMSSDRHLDVWRPSR